MTSIAVYTGVLAQLNSKIMYLTLDDHQRPVLIYTHPAPERVRLMPPIQQPNRAQTDHEFLVMQIMLPRRPSQEIVPRMHRRRFEQHERHEKPKRHHMRAEELWRDGDPQDVHDDVLDRVCVLRFEPT